MRQKAITPSYFILQRFPIIYLMILPEGAVEEFKSIHEKEFGEALSESEAQEMTARLLGLFQLLRHGLQELDSDLPDSKDSDTIKSCK